MKYLGEHCEIKVKDNCHVIVSEIDNTTWLTNWLGSNEGFQLNSRPVYTYVKGTSLSKGRFDNELGENDIYVMMYSGLWNSWCILSLLNPPTVYISILIFCAALFLQD